MDDCCLQPNLKRLFKRKGKKTICLSFIILNHHYYKHTWFCWVTVCTGITIRTLTCVVIRKICTGPIILTWQTFTHVIVCKKRIKRSLSTSKIYLTEKVNFQDMKNERYEVNYKKIRSISQQDFYMKFS